jgi:hypothetical protein
MRRTQFVMKILLIFLIIGSVMYVQAYAGDLGLVDLLSSQLGITKDQAQGGAGSIFQVAKQNLSAKDFSSVAKAIPGIDQMMAAAPKMKESSGTLGAVSSMMGGKSNTLGGMAGLTQSFEKLGLSSDMVQKFTPIILDYVKNKGGEHVMSLLKSALL